MIRTSAEFVAGVRKNWYANQNEVIIFTVLELEKHSARLGILEDSGDDDENSRKADELGAKIFDLIMACNTPEEYIAAVERVFLNPTFN